MFATHSFTHYVSYEMLPFQVALRPRFDLIHY